MSITNFWGVSFIAIVIYLVGIGTGLCIDRKMSVKEAEQEPRWACFRGKKVC